MHHPTDRITHTTAFAQQSWSTKPRYGILYYYFIINSIVVVVTDADLVVVVDAVIDFVD